MRRRWTGETATRGDTTERGEGWTRKTLFPQECHADAKPVRIVLGYKCPPHGRRRTPVAGEPRQERGQAASTAHESGQCAPALSPYAAAGTPRCERPTTNSNKGPRLYVRTAQSRSSK